MAPVVAMSMSRPVARMRPPACTTNDPARIVIAPRPELSDPEAVITNARVPKSRVEPAVTTTFVVTVHGFAVGAQMSFATVAWAVAAASSTAPRQRDLTIPILPPLAEQPLCRVSNANAASCGRESPYDDALLL